MPVVEIARRLDRALQAVELKPTYEDLFQAEGGSVEEYLEQMHEMTVVTAIQVLFPLGTVCFGLVGTCRV